MIDKENLISVIVPIYNVEKYLNRCILSIIKQTYRNLEIILVDDGSPDECASICDEWAKKDSRIKVIHKENGGLSDARNKGLEIASGNYIGFVDSDDFIEETFYEKLYTALKKNSADLAICSYEYVDELEKKINNMQSPMKNECLTGIEALDKLSEKNWWYYVTAWNKLYKKEIFSDIKFPYGKRNEDLFICHKVFFKCKLIVTIEDALYNYVQRDNSIMSEITIKNFDEIDALYEAVMFYKGHNLVDKVIKIRPIIAGEMNYNLSLIHVKNVDDKKRIRKAVKTFKKAYFCVKEGITYKDYLKWTFPIMRIKIMKEVKAVRHKLGCLYREYKCFNKLFFKKNKIVLLDTPEHGNLGDQAIAVAERIFLKSCYPQKRICEVPHEKCRIEVKAIKCSVHKQDIVVIHGGGFIGSLWLEEHRTFIKILKKLKNKKMIVFPQTVYFDEKDKELLDEMIKTINDCKNITIALRDKKSYDLMESLKLKCKLMFVPDIVLSLEGKKTNKKTNGKILICLRRDTEKTTESESIIKCVEISGHTYDITDTVVDYQIDAKQSRIEVEKKIDEFSQYELVICDRLHAMIFSILAGTPCIAFDNISKKVSGVYEWIKDIEQIKCIDETVLSDDLIKEMIGKGHFIYDNRKLLPMYNKLWEK